MNLIKIALIDGALFFLIWLFIGFYSVDGNLDSVMSGIPILTIITAVFCYRGYVLAAKIQKENIGLLYAIRQGGLEGAALSSIFIMLMISESTLAAGGHLDGVAIFSWEFLEFLFEVGLPILLAGGLLGAVHAAGLFYLNKFLLHTS